MPTIHPDATFVAVSSSGERASAGANEECRGRVRVNETDAGIRSAYTTSLGRPETSAPPPIPQASACTTYAATKRSPRWVTVTDGRCDRRQKRRRDELHRGDDARLGRAPLAVRVDDHRDPGRPFGTVEQREGRLDPAQRAVAEDNEEDAQHRRRVRTHAVHDRERPGRPGCGGTVGQTANDLMILAACLPASPPTGGVSAAGAPPSRSRPRRKRRRRAS